MPDDASWRIAAASVRGTSHESADAPCQDAHQSILTSGTNEPILVIAVSDGAGSAPASEIGSKIAVTAVCEQADAWFASGGTISAMDRGVFSEWLSGVKEQIAERAAESDSEMRDFACTLLIAVVGNEGAAFAQLGDGAMVVRTQEREWSWVFWPQHGPYVNTTYFVTEDEALVRFECDADARRIDEIAVFSDGLEQLVLDHKERAAHDPFFDRMFPPLRASSSQDSGETLSEYLATYLGSPAVSDRTNDDVTLVLASRLAVVPVAAAGMGSESVDASDDTNPS